MKMNKKRPEAVNWEMALKELFYKRANGWGTTSTFRGEVSGEQVAWYDESTQLASGEPAGAFIVKWLKEAGASRRPAHNNNRLFVNVPRFAYAGAWHDCYYIDIRAAYPSIYSRICWDINFMPQHSVVGGGKIPLAPLARELADNKHARNAVVGIALSRHRTRWSDGRPERVAAAGGLFNPQLGWFCWSVLSWIAIRARSLGARYFNADGAIFSNERQALEYAEFLEDCGLDWSVKAQGDCVVWGVGSYSFIRDGEVAGVPRPFSAPATFLCDAIVSRMAFDYWNRLERAF